MRTHDSLVAGVVALATMAGPLGAQALAPDTSWVRRSALYEVFVQDFSPGRDTSGTRRPLAGFVPDQIVESFGFSPDGRHLTIAVREQQSSLLLAEGVAGVAPSPRRRR